MTSSEGLNLAGHLKAANQRNFQAGGPAYIPYLTCLSWVPVMRTLKSPEGHEVQVSGRGKTMRWGRLEQQVGGIFPGQLPP